MLTPLARVKEEDTRSEGKNKEKRKVDHLNVNDELQSYRHVGIGKFFEKYGGHEFDKFIEYLEKKGKTWT